MIKKEKHNYCLLHTVSTMHRLGVFLYLLMHNMKKEFNPTPPPPPVPTPWPTEPKTTLKNKIYDFKLALDLMIHSVRRVCMLVLSFSTF